MRHEPRQRYRIRSSQGELYATLLSMAVLSFIAGMGAGFLLLQLH